MRARSDGDCALVRWCVGGAYERTSSRTHELTNERSGAMAQELVVVGTGLAGLSATLAAVERGAAVTLITAGPVLSGSSPWAQGGVAAAVGADDSPALHAADTLAVGVGL